jgi:pheromone a factor receptor
MQYLRILIIAILSSVSLLSVVLYTLIQDWKTVYPWPGWEVVHSNFLEITPYPNSLWRSNHTWLFNVELTRWEFVYNAFMIFMIFGIHREALKSYQSAARYVFRYGPRSGLTGAPCMRSN